LGGFLPVDTCRKGKYNITTAETNISDRKKGHI